MRDRTAAVATWLVFAGLLAGCGGGVTGSTTATNTAGSGSSGTSAASGSGATSSLGVACIPQEEYDPTFQGFSIDNVSVETKAPTCATSVCLINHFQGRVSCPYGQISPGMGPVAPAGSPAAEAHSQDGCVVPGMTAGSPASQVSATNAAIPGYPAGSVPPQVAGVAEGDRTANHTVYCSCRCANAAGNTDDGADYCACPESYSCTQLVTSLGMADQSMTGAYCVQSGTLYNPTLSTNETCAASVTVPTGPGYCPPQQ